MQVEQKNIDVYKRQAIKIIVPTSSTNPAPNIINPIIVPVQIPMITRSKPMTVNITDNLVTILSGIRCISIISILPILWCISFIEPFV